MKKLLLSTAVLLASFSLFAASTGTLTISGTVNPINDLVITPTSDATALNIIGGETAKLVANVQETSNNLNGYAINMKSQNASELRHSIDASKLTTYTVSYDGGPAMSLTTADQEVKRVNSLPGLTVDTSAVSVNVAPFANAPAGTYSDVITITIVAN